MTNASQSRTGYVEVNGAQLYYEIAGSGPAVALLHFGIGDSRAWDDQFPVLAERYTVVRYDYRGFGKSSMPPGEYSQRADLDGLLTALGIGTVALVGVSMGGGLTMDYALEHPDRVTALVPVGAAPSGGKPTAEQEAEMERIFAPVEEAEKADDIERANDIEVHIWVDGINRTPEQVPADVREKVRMMNLESWRRQDELKQGKPQPLDPPAATRLGEIRVPALVIVGDEDLPDLIGAADIMAAVIPGAQKAVMHGTAHAPNMEKPDEFNRLVLDFLGQHLK
jgi:pimeloyl-ACP methyl ester carboxylesterase